MERRGIGHIHVACAIIERNGTVLAAQRKEGMRMALKWEFPGGKIEAEENPEACLKRELIEEMGIYIAIGHPLDPMTYQYSSFMVTLYPFVCTILSGGITLHEHADVVWLPPEELLSQDWAEADVPLIKQYLKSRQGAK
ncbi:MAG: (deoxy)nucleoside triphosphate pyrophosphohydrolase [Proteobacteria bacterium]|nr:(deoxy)nucleoside triphosphate pyrophosphohydrolase [Pseudomonadota bacterium]